MHIHVSTFLDVEGATMCDDTDVRLCPWGNSIPGGISFLKKKLHGGRGRAYNKNHLPYLVLKNMGDDQFKFKYLSRNFSYRLT